MKQSQGYLHNEGLLSEKATLSLVSDRGKVILQTVDLCRLSLSSKRKKLTGGQGLKKISGDHCSQGRKLGGKKKQIKSYPPRETIVRVTNKRHRPTKRLRFHLQIIHCSPRVGPQRRLSTKGLMLSNCGAGEDS